MIESCTHFLSTFLPEYLVYKSVVIASVNAMAKLDDVSFKSIEGSAMAKPWSIFRALLLERAVLKVELNLWGSESKLLCGFVRFFICQSLYTEI